MDNNAQGHSGKKKGSMLAGTLVMGAVGAAAGAVAVVMSDKGNQRKVKNFVGRVQVKGRELHEMAMKRLDEMEEKGKDAKKAVKTAKSKATKKVTAVKRAVK